MARNISRFLILSLALAPWLSRQDRPIRGLMTATAALTVWLLGRIVYFGSLILAFVIAWGLRITAIGSALTVVFYGVAVLTHRTDFFLNFFHSGHAAVTTLLR
jgi:hypothetical protein